MIPGHHMEFKEFQLSVRKTHLLHTLCIILEVIEITLLVYSIVNHA